jgi:hypothetical protein
MEMENPAPEMDMMDAMSQKSKMSSKKPSEKMSEKMSEKSKKDEMMMMDEEEQPMMMEEAAGMTAALGGAAGDALGLNAFGGSDGSDNTKFREPVRTDCCCCLCGCSNELTENVKCCFCLPIKAGIVIIGMIVLLLAGTQFLNAYMQFMNATTPWWKPTVTIVLISPAVVSVCFFIGWYTKDCTRTRSTLTAAVIQGLTSYVLVIIWQIIYFFAIEKKDQVGSGFGDDLDTYRFQSKKRFIYGQLAMGIVAIAFYIFAIGSVRAFVNCYPDKSEYEAKADKKK